jgi:DNA gyrase subunit A
VVSYIEFLEAELRRYRKPSPAEETPVESELPPMKPNEPPGTRCVITLTGNGIAKKTSRHLYIRQRRGGMGIYDLDTPENDPPVALVECEEGQHLLLFTNLARAFRYPTSQLVAAEIRNRGQNITQRFGLLEGETIVAALPDETRGGVALVSEWGFVRYLRHHVFGEYMKPGAVMFDARKFGPLSSACRTPGDGDLFIATQGGKAIRFSEKLVPPQGGPGMRVESPDRVVAVTAVYDDSTVFLADANGRGSLRQMASFTANKSPGGGGKIAMHTGELTLAMTVSIDDDIFLISRLSKLIRFMASEVPVKDAPVQGVNCMLFRADEVVAGAKA